MFLLCVTELCFRTNVMKIKKNKKKTNLVSLKYNCKKAFCVAINLTEVHVHDRTMVTAEGDPFNSILMIWISSIVIYNPANETAS